MPKESPAYELFKAKLYSDRFPYFLAVYLQNYHETKAMLSCL